ncbi:MAG TPA: DUF4388 domain-containing protein [Planktothrix sp.]|jgi:GGDEF domain-containing protein
MGDIHYLLSQALEDRGHSFEICWTPPGYIHEYVLSVEANTRGGDAQWKMFQGLSQDSKPLWTYISCDVLLVYNLVNSTASDQNKAALDKQQSENPSTSASNISALVRRDVTSTTTSSNPTVAVGGGKKPQALAGDLSMVQMPTLLQSILMAKMTGVLDCEDPDGRGRSQVFFVDGQAMHCVASDSYGEEGVLELLSWKDGTFNFKAGETNEVRTIKKPLDSLLLQGMTLIDNAAYLANLGVTTESHLVMLHQDLADADMEAIAKKGAPVAMQKQKQMYRAISPDKSLQDILEKLIWPRSQWVPVLCNLMKTELVAVVPKPVEEPSQVIMEPKRIDKRLIQNVMMSLRRPETGLFTYAAFLYFMEQEYFRAYRSANPMSVVLFQMRVQGTAGDAPAAPLPMGALSAAVRKISGLKRHVDLLAHYENHDYALLLPNTKGAGALVLAARLYNGLMTEALIPGMVTPQNFKVAFGIACIPEDFRDLSLILASAEIAMNAAAAGPEPIISFSTIAHKYVLPGQPNPPG